MNSRVRNGRRDSALKVKEASPPGKAETGADQKQGSASKKGQGATSKFSFDAAFLSILFVPFVMVLGNSILIPVLPAMGAAMHLSPAQTGLIITAFSVPAGLFIPFAGFLADRYGRKTVMVPSLFVYSAGGFIAVAAAIFLRENAYGLLMAGRVVQGLGAAGTANIAMALTGDLYVGGARGQALGLLEASNGFGKVAGPVLGAAFGLIVWFAPFVFFASITVPVALALWLLAQDRKPEESRSVGKYFGSVLKVFGEKGVPLGMALVAGSAVLFLLFGVLFYLSEILETQFGLQGMVKGLVLALPVLASAISAYITGTFFQKKVDRRYLVTGGLGLIALSLASLAVIQNSYYLYVAIFFIGVGSGAALVTLNVLVTGSVSLERRAIITSGYGAVRFFGVAMGPPLFGLVMGMGNLIMFAGAAALGALTAAGAFVLIDQKRLLA